MKRLSETSVVLILAATCQDFDMLLHILKEQFCNKVVKSLCVRDARNWKNNSVQVTNAYVNKKRLYEIFQVDQVLR